MITGHIFYPQQFTRISQKSGEFKWQGPPADSHDTGLSRIEGDAIRQQFQKTRGGVEYASTVFRYPGGTFEGKNEYFFCSDFGFATFSVDR
jgi:hypothetical protein